MESSSSDQETEDYLKKNFKLSFLPTKSELESPNHAGVLFYFPERHQNLTQTLQQQNFFLDGDLMKLVPEKLRNSRSLGDASRQQPIILNSEKSTGLVISLYLIFIYSFQFLIFKTIFYNQVGRWIKRKEFPHYRVQIKVIGTQ